MTNKQQLAAITAEEHAQLIADCKDEIIGLREQIIECGDDGYAQMHLESKLKRQQIALASLEAGKIFLAQSLEHPHLLVRVDSQRFDSIVDGCRGKFVAYTAPPVAVMQPVTCPTFNDYVPHIAKELRAAFTNAILAAGGSVKE